MAARGPRPGAQSPLGCFVFVAEAARQTRVDPWLLAAIVHVESRGRPGAVSPRGAIGCAQLMPATARALGVDPWDPRDNVLGAARYLRRLEAMLRGRVPERFGWLPVVAAYHAGPAVVLRHAGRVPYRSTLAYVRRVAAVRRALLRRAAARAAGRHASLPAPRGRDVSAAVAADGSEGSRAR